MNDTTQTLNNPTTEQLLTALFGVFDNHIKHLVDQRVNAIFEAHATMKQLDEQWEQRIRGYIQESMDEHETDYDHPTNDDISDTVATHIAHIDFTDNIRRSVEEIITDGDYPNEERVTEMIDEADIEDRVKEVLRNI
jgi:hypothetical protein